MVGPHLFHAEATRISAPLEFAELAKKARMSATNRGFVPPSPRAGGAGTLDDELHVPAGSTQDCEAGSADGQYEWFQEIAAADVPGLLTRVGAIANGDVLDMLERDWCGHRSYAPERLRATAGIVCTSSGAACDEDELSSRSIGCIADLVQQITVRHE